jgi:serine phosphatase RsbU (regulator of sigma subunit)
MSLPEPHLEAEAEAQSEVARGLFNPDTAVAIFRTVFVIIMVVSMFRTRGTLGWFTQLDLVAILAAVYNVTLLVMYRLGLYLPGHHLFTLSLDIVFITLWVGLSRVFGLGAGFFALYYALVFIAALQFGVKGAALTGVISGALYLGILAWIGHQSAAVIAQTLRQYVLVLLLVVILVGYIAEAQARQRAASIETRTELTRYQTHHRLMQEFYDLINPAKLLTPPGLDVGVSFRAAVRMGAGDYYDLLDLGHGQYAVCVADVAGKYGAEVLHVPVVKYALKVASAVERRPSRVLERVNELVFDELQPDRFVTMFYGQIDPWRGGVTYVNAGHDSPLLVRCEGAVETLEAGGLVLGVLRQARYDEGVAQLKPGDALVLYTDGAVDAAAANGVEFGVERVAQAARKALEQNDSAAAAAQQILKAIEDYAAGSVRRDDITIMVVRLADRQSQAAQTPPAGGDDTAAAAP